MKKKVLLVAGVTAITLLAGGSILLTQAYAQDGDAEEYRPIVQAIAEEFGLDEDEVNKVFVDHHQQMKQEREQKIHDALDQAVADGKITEEQKTDILKKHEMIRQNRGEHRENQREFHEWLDENDIDLRDILGGECGMMGREMKGRMMGRVGHGFAE